MKSLNGSNRVYDGDRARESYHESSHLFAFLHYGIRVDFVEVGDNFGRTRVPPQDIDDLLGYIVALCAGRAAVNKWRGYKTTGDEAGWRKSKDRALAHEAALKVSKGDHKAALLLMRWAERMADSFVEAHWHELHEPARLLAEKGTLKVVR